MVRLLSTRVHGMLDYLVGLLLIASPWIFGFDDNNRAMWVPIALGLAALVYSLMTDYELGAFRVVPMRVHLMLDMGSGVLLAASPWLLGFSDDVWVPHVALGLFEILVAAITSPVPERDETSIAGPLRSR